MLELTMIQKIAVWTLPILLSVTLHEAAHAYVADRLGDKTARIIGRLTLNPIKHIDLFGTILLPLLIGLSTQFHFLFGYAKPVPVNPYVFKKPKRDLLLVAIAGPIANFIMAIIWATLYKFATFYDNGHSSAILFILLTANAGIILNLILACFNLLPIPPLDGASVLRYFLSPRYETYLDKIEPYGMPLMLILMFTGVLSFVLTPMIQFCLYLITQLFQI